MAVNESAVPESDYEQQFVSNLVEQFDEEIVDKAIEEGEEEPKPKAKPKAKEEEEPDEDADGSADDGEDAEEETTEEEDGEEEEEDEEGPRISLRIDGKKVDPSEVLKHMVFTPKVDGEEIEVDYDELISGYQRYGDYTRKQSELKKEREEIQPYAKLVAHAKEDPKFAEHIKSYFENGPFATDIQKNPLLKVSDEQLAGMMDRESDNYDPDQASQVIKARSEWQRTASERQQVQQKVQAQQAQMYQQWASEQIQVARQRIDSIGGEGTYDKIGPQVLETYSKLGFNEQEIGGQAPISATDARFAELAFKASEYDRMMKENEAPKVRLGKKRKTLTPPRSLKAGTGNRQPSSSKRSRAQYKRAVETQREDDWLPVIAERMKL